MALEVNGYHFDLNHATNWIIRKDADTADGDVRVSRRKMSGVLKVHGFATPTPTLVPLAHRSVIPAPCDLTSFILPFGLWLSAPIVSLCFITPFVTAFWVIADDAREQRPNTVRCAAVALAVHNILPRLDPCCLVGCMRWLDFPRSARDINTYAVETSKI